MQLTPFCFRHYDLSSRAGEVQFYTPGYITATPVPEPNSTSMMILGFGFVFSAFKKRKNIV